MMRKRPRMPPAQRLKRDSRESAVLKASRPTPLSLKGAQIRRSALEGETAVNAFEGALRRRMQKADDE
jgi:hypothetical protein